MNKARAAAIVNKRLGSQKLNPSNGGNVIWANINAAKDVWWADIPVKKFTNDLYFILNDDTKSMFVLIAIEHDRIKLPYNHFRKLREGYISVEISSRKRNRFIDVKSGGTNFNFANFKTHAFDYSKVTEIAAKSRNLPAATTINHNKDAGDRYPSPVILLQSKMSVLFEKLSSIQEEIKKELIDHSDNKNLKGNEIVGWIGEIY